MMLITEKDNPIDLFAEWLEEAGKTEPEYPEAMTLATSTKEGRPSARMVLLKDFDDRGFTFYTNLGSAKAAQLDVNPMAALCFHWKSLHRQIRVEGRVEPVSEAEADEYFASRARLSQIGAWASKQSQSLEGRWVFEKRIAEFTAKFNVGSVPRPEFWSGYRVVPDHIEFWLEAKFRLHDRLVYDRDGETWRTDRLYP